MSRVESGSIGSTSTIATSTIKTCQLCSDRQPSLKYLLKHIRQVHAHKPYFRIPCQLNGCTRVFHKFEVFRNHVYDFHTDAERVVPVPSMEPPIDEAEDDSQEDGLNDSFSSSQQAFSRSPDRKKSAAMWILKIQETFKLPQNSMEQILRDITGFIEDMLIDLHADVTSMLNIAGIDPSSIPDLSTLFSTGSVYAAPFAGLETHHLQMKYYKESLGFVEPRPVLLGLEKQWIGSGVQRTYSEVREEMMYIPILETIQNLLNNPDVYKQVCTQRHSSDGILRDYCDGSHFLTHPLAQLDSNFLQIFLYYDDLEVCNPLGSKRIIHKLGLFYFVLGNLSPELRSKLGHIQLAAIAKSAHIKKYGANAILRPIIEDIQKLEHGHSFTVNGLPETKYGSICVIPADNLASNAIGGFKEGSQATHGCRHCTATPIEMKSIFSESKLILRNPADHSIQCDRLEAALNLKDHERLSTEFGINHRSIIDSLQYFNVCDGGMIQDLMHDVLEGVLEYETKELLVQHIDKDHLYSLEYLNQKICGVELGHMETRDRPSTIATNTLHSTDHKLKQQASQMWLLGRLLPQLVGNRVPKDDEYWANYLLDLNEYCRHTIGTSINRG